MNSTCGKICLGNGRLFYFNDNGKLDLYYILKIIYPLIKNNVSVLLIECIEMNWKCKNANGLCVLIFMKNTGWYLCDIENLHNDESIIYIFTLKVQDCTPSIFNKTLYHCWYK